MSFHLKNITSPFINNPSGMLLLCDMGGNHHSCQLTAYMWPIVFGPPCLIVPKRRISINSTQWIKGLHCFVAICNLPWSCCWALPTAYHQWEICTCYHQHSRWSSLGYCTWWILGWPIWKSLLWYQDIQSFCSLKQSLLYLGNIQAPCMRTSKKENMKRV